MAGWLALTGCGVALIAFAQGRWRCCCWGRCWSLPGWSGRFWRPGGRPAAGVADGAVERTGNGSAAAVSSRPLFRPRTTSIGRGRSGPTSPPQGRPAAAAPSVDVRSRSRRTGERRLPISTPACRPDRLPWPLGSHRAEGGPPGSGSRPRRAAPSLAPSRRWPSWPGSARGRAPSPSPGHSGNAALPTAGPSPAGSGAPTGPAAGPSAGGAGSSQRPAAQQRPQVFVEPFGSDPFGLGVGRAVLVGL